MKEFNWIIAAIMYSIFWIFIGSLLIFIAEQSLLFFLGNPVDLSFWWWDLQTEQRYMIAGVLGLLSQLIWPQDIEKIPFKQGPLRD